MKTRIAFSVFVLGLAGHVFGADLGSGINYQGSLNDGGSPANGAYDFRFVLRDAASGGNPVGPTLTNQPVAVAEGEFNVTLDFGAAAFDGRALWLEIGVRTNGAASDYDTLAPAQPLNAVPYALFAKNVSGPMPGPVSFTNPSNVFAGDGSGLTGIHSLDAADGSPAEAVYVDNEGRVGVGAKNPIQEITNARLRVSAGHIVLDNNYGVLAARSFVVTNPNGNPLFTTERRFSGFDTDVDGGLTLWADNPIASSGWVRVTPAGAVGIGTQSPAEKLDVVGNVRAQHFIGDGSQLTGIASESAHSLSSPDGSRKDVVAVDNAGAVGITGTVTARANLVVSGNLGIATSTPQAPLDVVSSSGSEFLRVAAAPTAPYGASMSLDATAVPGGKKYVLYSTGATHSWGRGKLQLYNETDRILNILVVDTNGNVGFGTASPAAKVDVAGTARVDVLEIDGGSDVAEPYHIAPAREVAPQPGMLVSIDPNQVGRMRVACGCYDRTVAGIISGANGIRPGITLHQEGTVADGAMPVAGVGRVWAYCDADANGAVRAGDLLTTSDTPGYAMRVTDHERANGATVGKAMSNLEHGKGLVLVFVSLK